MSPKPTVAYTVTVKYSAPVRVSGPPALLFHDGRPVSLAGCPGAPGSR